MKYIEFETKESKLKKILVKSDIGFYFALFLVLFFFIYGLLSFINIDISEDNRKTASSQYTYNGSLEVISYSHLDTFLEQYVLHDPDTNILYCLICAKTTSVERSALHLEMLKNADGTPKTLNN